ncbi:hypothetical protein DL768_010610 [Monosporascus sp. mg162]|nr:hypothetical protein DL768_010610 [Monosporascus sp. mg162]
MPNFIPRALLGGPWLDPNLRDPGDPQEAAEAEDDGDEPEGRRQPAHVLDQVEYLMRVGVGGQGFLTSSHTGSSDTPRRSPPIQKSTRSTGMDYIYYDIAVDAIRWRAPPTSTSSSTTTHLPVHRNDEHGDRAAQHAR